MTAPPPASVPVFGYQPGHGAARDVLRYLSFWLDQTERMAEGTDEQPIIDPFTFDSFKIELTNHVEPFVSGSRLAPTDALDCHFEATMFISAADYAGLTAHHLPEPTYTVRIDQDLNPWHREVTGWRSRLEKLRDGLWWTFRKRVLRRKLIDSYSVTIPGCRMAVLEPEKDQS